MIGALLGALAMYVYLRRQGMEAPLPQISQFEARILATLRQTRKPPLLMEEGFPELIIQEGETP